MPCLEFSSIIRGRVTSRVGLIIVFPWRVNRSAHSARRHPSGVTTSIFFFSDPRRLVAGKYSLRARCRGSMALKIRMLVGQ